MAGTDAPGWEYGLLPYGGGADHRTCEDGATCTDPEHMEVRR